MEGKKKIVVALLAIFLGAYGIHNFYLGYTKKAIIQLVCTISGIVLGTVGMLIIVGAVFLLVPTAMAIWGFIEGIMVLTGNISEDANGVPLID